ncbi:AlpA family transcriptional regulator [Herbaspirillum sp. SJZ107]|uniref:helix-turn-helix transcriptional regulator n=1 Tax=Herbaspirillum sp. SJZ107 TaxID=2572881 RepID=UPI001154D722|nr:AlpA family transcriptional regulator [Herbaspirillum sp. SJZ107]TQK00160.1 AlpA family transcriptional regulator [Herbaspirillum sp. SJZ107]
MNIITLERVTEKTTLGRSSVYNYMKDGRFPASVRLGERHVGWVEAEVDDWVKKQVAASRAEQSNEVPA